jgi:hypothetical protein
MRATGDGSFELFAHGATDKQSEMMNQYAQSFLDYTIGLSPYRVATPVVLSDKQSAQVRSLVRTYIKEHLPGRATRSA